MTMTQNRPATRQHPATPAQRKFIVDLLNKRDLTGTAYQGWTPDWDRANVKTASAVIDYLKTLPLKPAEQAEVTEAEATHDEADEQPAPARQPFGAAWAAIPVGGAGFGYYALEVGPGEHKFFRVERKATGKWAGMTFIKEQAGDAFYPIEPRGRGYAYLSEIAKDHEAAGMLYASLIGHCFKCNRTLTTAESRARGMGPDCAERS